MIGDRLYDIQGGQQNQVRAVGVTWGYGTPGELLAAGASQILEHPIALQGMLRSLR